MCGSVHQGVFSTLGEIMSISGVLNTSEGTMSAWGGGISWIHWRISWCKWGIPWVHWGMFSTSGDIMSTLGFSIEIERIYQVAPLNDIPLMHWISPNVLMKFSPPPPNELMISLPSNVLMVFLGCTEHPPMYTWYLPTFIMISPDVLNIPWCTEYPPIYWTHIIQGEHFIDE